MTFSQWLFSFEGRIGRGRFWASLGVQLLIGLVMTLLLLSVNPTILNDPPKLNPAGSLIYLAFSIFSTWITLAVAAKRSHDRGRSAWFLLLYLIPIVNIWALIDLGFLKGEVGPNRFGADPQNQAPVSSAAVRVEPQLHS
ncbi:DUF805 domain-containing protein [Rhodomicrobium vannielii ATCC 17100]|uniref:DUF805 domain-containing protein n=1 Tax=Rhodomicrobium udaipurense TaxID=1202716 RepID=A0A8I1GGV7_9HYPH|nr:MULTISPECIES: DUF805 domain-containing protein [Rhodomicrobium]MBJ7534735.1 DUF805 domain-containing protein [Rhodomicrobium vannielii ATCC 17100]MBJ7542707.1 DUF805 domain-containing protein [Rhodomicrobium udaipurense]